MFEKKNQVYKAKTDRAILTGRELNTKLNIRLDNIMD